ncbi:MAG: flagellar motor switch protein FliG [Chloroflexota bacterium]
MPAPPRPAGALRGRQKAATLLIALGPEIAANVLRHLKESEVERLTMEIFAMEKVTEDLKDQVLEECYEMALARDFITSGGADYAREMLQQALGEQKANEILGKLVAARRPHAFDFVRDTDPGQLISFLQSEHPQTIALILSHLEPQQAAVIISGLPENLQSQVAMRIANMDRTPPEVVEHVERVLKRRLASVLNRDFTSVGGIDFLVKIINKVDRGTEKSILENLEQMNPDLAAQVRKLMFVFEDLVTLDDRSLQRVLREVDPKDLALALKGASDELRKKVFRNLSTRAAAMLQEEIEMSGPVRLRQVEEAQMRIVEVVRRLDEAEEIVISRGEDDVLL